MLEIHTHIPEANASLQPTLDVSIMAWARNEEYVPGLARVICSCDGEQSRHLQQTICPVCPD